MKFLFSKFPLAVLGALLLLLMMAPVAFGATDPNPSTHLVLPTDQMWAWLGASFVALVAYPLNKYGPHVNETVKGGVYALAAAIGAGITQAVTAGNVGFNDTTLQFILLSVGAAFVAHITIFKPTGLSATLGAGQNR